MNDFNDMIKKLKGMSKTPEELAEYEAIEEERKRSAREMALKGWAVPLRIRRNILEGIKKTKATDRVDVLAESESREDWCLVLASTPGTGKSTAAGYWLWLKTKIVDIDSQLFGDSRWYSAIEIYNMSSFGDDIKKVCEVPTLVIDDLGTEYSDKGGHFASRLDLIIDHRYRECRPTIITTNLNRSLFQEHYSERVFDRLKEGGAFYEFSGENMRGRE